jgi:hypothetical protein
MKFEKGQTSNWDVGRTALSLLTTGDVSFQSTAEAAIIGIKAMMTSPAFPANHFLPAVLLSNAFRTRVTPESFLASLCILFLIASFGQLC